MKTIELFQVGQTSLTEDFTRYAAGIYWKKMSMSAAEKAASPITTVFGGTFDSGISEDPVDITGAAFENIALAQLNSIAELYLQDGSFFYEFNAQTVYISIFDYRNFATGDTIAVGETLGFIDKAQQVDINGANYPLDTFIGSVLYEPRLNSVSIVNSINDQKNGIFVYSDLEVSIQNKDGKFDDITESITGNTALLLVAQLSESPEEEIETGFPYKLAAESSDFVIKRSGVVETVDYSDPDNPTIRAIDERANWTQTINTNLLTLAEFPDLPDKYVNDRKAICIGPVNGVQAVPLRDDSTAAAFDYFVCDTTIGNIQSVSQVYFKGQLDTGGGKEDVDRFLTGGEYSVNLSTGIITISDCIKGDVFVYGIFTTMTETIEIILFLLLTYADLAYVDANFNKAEIEVIRDLDYTTHVYISGKGQRLSKVIEKLCDDIKTDMFPQGDVLTMRQSNVLGIPTETLKNYQIVENPPSWNTNRTDTIKTIRVNYNMDYRTKLSESYYDDSLEQEAVDNNRKAIDQVFPVKDTEAINLTDVADVESIYTTYYERFINVPRTVELSKIYAFMSGLADFIIFPVIRTRLSGEKTIFVDGIYKITTIDEIENSVECVFFKNADDQASIRTLSYDALSYTFLSGRG